MKIGHQSTIEPGPSGHVGAIVTCVRASPRRPQAKALAPPERVRTLTRLVGRVDDAIHPVRAAQIVLLRDAVAAGRYDPDLREVARSLLIAVAAEPRR